MKNIILFLGVFMLLCMARHVSAHNLTVYDILPNLQSFMNGEIVTIRGENYEKCYHKISKSQRVPGGYDTSIEEAYEPLSPKIFYYYSSYKTYNVDSPYGSGLIGICTKNSY